MTGPLAPIPPTPAAETPRPHHQPGPRQGAATTPDDGAAEAALVGRLKSGDERAFEELVALAAPRMLAVARRMLAREEDAQDAVQEAFLSAFRALGDFDGRSRFTTWLHRITVNACLMKLRSRRRRPERSIEELLPEFLPDGHQKTPARPWRPIESLGIERDEVRALVRSCIEELPEQYRTVLVLRDVEGLDTEETAAVLEVSPNAVKTRLHRARQALRALLDPHMSGGSA